MYGTNLRVDKFSFLYYYKNYQSKTPSLKRKKLRREMCALQTGVSNRLEEYSALDSSRIEEFYHRALEKSKVVIIEDIRYEYRKLDAVHNVISMATRTLIFISAEGNFPNCNFTDKQLFALGVFMRKIGGIFILAEHSSEKKALERFFKRTFRYRKYTKPAGEEGFFKVDSCNKTAVLDNFYSNIFDGYKIIVDRETGVNNIQALTAFIVKVISANRYFTIANSADDSKFDTDLDFLNKGEFSLEQFHKSALSGYEEDVSTILKYFLVSDDVDFKGLNDTELELYTNILSSGDFDKRDIDNSGVAEFAYFKEVYDLL